MCREETYFEIDVDIGSSYAASSVVNLVKGATKSMVIDFGVLVEGKAEDELPERLIGAETARFFPALPRKGRQGNCGRNCRACSCVDCCDRELTQDAVHAPPLPLEQATVPCTSAPHAVVRVTHTASRETFGVTGGHCVAPAYHCRRLAFVRPRCCSTQGPAQLTCYSVTCFIQLLPDH